MAKKTPTETDPFIALSLRGFIEALDPYEIAVCAALQFWHWAKKGDGGLGPEGLAVLTRMSASKAKAVAGTLYRRGWLIKEHGRRDLKERTRYRLSIQPTTWDAAKAWATVRLPQSQMVSDHSATTELPLGLTADGRTPPESRTNIKILDLREKTRDAPTAPASEIQAEHKKGYGYLRAAFAKLPSPPIITESLGIEVGRVNRKAQGVGLKDFQRVVDAYCKDEYAGKSIGNFLSVFDRLANKLLGAEREVRARRQRELKTLFTELREQPNG